MSKKRRMHKVVATVGLAMLLGAALLLTRSSADAHIVPTPCDFTTGGGFVITDEGEHGNFGLVGGCKNGGFYGHVNFVDHDESSFFAGLHVTSTSITGYFDTGIPSFPSGYREICGTADTNLFGPVTFRVRTYDGGEPGAGVDRFGIELAQNGARAVVVDTRGLAGGNIQLHKPNPSTTGPFPPPDEETGCPGTTPSLLGP